MLNRERADEHHISHLSSFLLFVCCQFHCYLKVYRIGQKYIQIQTDQISIHIRIAAHVFNNSSSFHHPFSFAEYQPNRNKIWIFVGVLCHLLCVWLVDIRIIACIPDSVSMLIGQLTTLFAWTKAYLIVCIRQLYFCIRIWGRHIFKTVANATFSKAAQWLIDSLPNIKPYHLFLRTEQAHTHTRITYNVHMPAQIAFKSMMA